MDPRPVEVWSHDTYWPGALHEWQQIDGTWWALVSYTITLEMPDAHGPAVRDPRGEAHVAAPADVPARVNRPSPARLRR